MKTNNFMKFLSILLILTILLITVTSAVSAVTPTVDSNNSVTCNELSQSPCDNLQVSNIPSNALGTPNGVNTYVGVNVTANGVGTSDNPYNNLELALNASHENDTIIIMDGVYTGAYNTQQTINLNGLTIKADSNANPIFDGNQSRIFTISANDVILSGLTFINAHSTLDGGAIFAKSISNLSISNCTFVNNTAGRDGGGIELDYISNLSIFNCTFVNNNATRFSGALNFYGGNNLLINKCYFDKNNAVSGGAIRYQRSTNITVNDSLFTNNYVIEYGGGINVEQSNYCLFDNCQFYNNTAKGTKTNTRGLGGGLFLGGNNLRVNNSIFKYNNARVGAGLRFGADVGSVNCSLENLLVEDNHATVHGGGICQHATNSTIRNCNIINNTAPFSGGIHVHSTSNLFENINLINNTVIDFGAGISIINDYKIIKNLTNTIRNCSFVNNVVTSSSGYGAGIEIKGGYAVVDNCTLINNTAADGAAIHIIGENTTIKNCDILNNSAKNVGGGIWINGSNATVFNSNIYDNTASDGAGIDITGNDTNISNVKVYGNLANNGAGLYINGNRLTFTDSVVYNNNASVNGGGAYVEGNESYLKNVTFTYNNAIPDYDKLDDGLGGAFMVSGENTTVLDSLFDFNTARNGSAIYSSGTGVEINNTIFHDNQAWIYWIPTNHNETCIYSNLYGGNNILNAIYNNDSFTSIKIDGSNPVDGAENSLNGTILYQDCRELNQIIVTEVWDAHGNFIYNGTKITDLYGYVEYPISLDTKLWYVVRMTHLEDTYYKAITNTTVLNNLAGLNITNVIMYEGDTTPQLINIVLANNHLNAISNASTVNIYVKVNGTYIYLGSQNTNDVGMVKLEESNIFHTLPVGEYELFANYTNTDGKYNLCNTTGKLTVLPLYYHITKTVIGNNNVKVGDSISFIIHFSNDVNHTLSSVRVSDIIPSGLSLTSYSAKGWTYEGSGVWTYNGLFPALGTSDIIVNFIATKAGNYTNIAIVTPNNINGTNSSNVTVQITNKSTIHPNDTHENGIAPNVVETNKDSSTLNYGVKMQHTGLPILVLILAILAILAGGLKRKN
jgi:uncharacterized repeat protein (TIGR01451 family)